MSGFGTFMTSQAGVQAGLGIFGGLLGLGMQRKQQKHNMELAEFQDAANTRYMDRMNEYNTPYNQMRRFEDAGLNPHLVYGQGSAGNQSTPQQYPSIQPTDMSRVLQNLPALNQTLMTGSQIQALQARTNKDTVMTEVAQLQKQVIAKNPLLNETAFNAIIDGLKATAASKIAQGDMDVTKSLWFHSGRDRGDGIWSQAGWLKMDKELELLEQQFNLREADQAIKAEILETKEFENAILEVQKRFMVDGDITNQHIVQFITLFMQRFMR